MGGARGSGGILSFLNSSSRRLVVVTMIIPPLAPLLSFMYDLPCSGAIIFRGGRRKPGWLAGNRNKTAG